MNQVIGNRKAVAPGIGVLKSDFEHALSHNVSIASRKRSSSALDHVGVEGIHIEEGVATILGRFSGNALAESLRGWMPSAHGFHDEREELLA